MNAIFHEFNPEIYPLKLWVCLNATAGEVINKFIVDSPMETERSLKRNSATVTLVRNSEGRPKGVLVFSESPKFMTGSIIAHESAHVADAFYEELGMIGQAFSENNEPYCYLVGWAAKCINEARIHKVSKKLAK